MKISLRWMCDHLSISWNKINVPALIDYFNTRVAEIETVHDYHLDLSLFYVARVEKITKDTLLLVIPELKKQVSLSGSANVTVGSWYLVKKEKTTFLWVTYQDLAIEKEGYLPAFRVDAKSATTGSWRKQIESADVIFDIDNKSITHRPDLWSHRGIAREIAFFLKTTLISEKKLLAKVPVKRSEKNFKSTKIFPISVKKNAKECSFFSALYFEHIDYSPSVLWMSFRLLRVNQRPIDYLIDTTNYVMFDWGQPLHAFDAQKISGSIFGPHMAKNGEQLTLLDGTHLTLQNTDLVVVDHEKTLALAGIKGGANSGITPQTTSLLLEAATFNGGIIRASSCFHKIRTESSTRFEKELDPTQTIEGIERFVKLLMHDNTISFKHSPYLVSIGSLPKPTVIELSQNSVESRLGVIFKKGEIEKILKSLYFKIITRTVKNKKIFKVVVPSYRATKDISIQEDLMEEIGRIYGYGNLPEQLPLFERKPVLERWESKLFLCKNFLAFTGKMREVFNYSLLDNEFLKKINWHVTLPVNIAHPLSEQATTLTDSLVISLLKNIDEASSQHEMVSFFEWGKTWVTDPEKKELVYERSMLAGIKYERKYQIDFYAGADLLKDLYALLGMSLVLKKCAHQPIWAHRYQCADLVVNEHVVGKVGMISSVIMNKLGGGQAWAFELDGTFLLHHSQDKKVFVPFSKYQGSYLDVSMMVPSSYSVETLEMIIKSANKHIINVQLQDIFQKPEWKTEKSVTFRYFIEDPKNAVSKELLDQVKQAVQQAVHSLGVHIR